MDQKIDTDSIKKDAFLYLRELDDLCGRIEGLDRWEILLAYGKQMPELAVDIIKLIKSKEGLTYADAYSALRLSITYLQAESKFVPVGK